MHAGRTIEEFSDNQPLPRRGFTSIEATEFLHREFPQIPRWTCWWQGWAKSRYVLQKIVGKDCATSGTIGEWSWKRITTSYPTPHYWDGEDYKRREGDRWAGMIEVQGPDVTPFLLFSFLDSSGQVGRTYFASTQDITLLRRFAEALQHHFYPEEKDTILIEVHGGASIALQPEDDERLILPTELQHDIEQQVYSFFENKAVYTRLRVRHRRGFLFVGEPGTGKTMMLRHLIRQSNQRYKPSFFMLTIRRTTDVDDVARLFAHAVKGAPALVILEDMDSLTTQSQITRAALLAQLDGVGSKDGLLIIGTTNNAGEIDPALVHRPSRFDRVWHFPLPNYTLRLKYLAENLGNLDGKCLNWLAEHTDGWSFAYLNELRTTTAILGISRQAGDVTAETAKEAHTLLAAQFNSGRKNHAGQERTTAVGFQPVTA
jgi:hypothetical protein